MKREAERYAVGNIWPISALVLAATGVTVAGTGLYFIFLRPPLLSEDLRYLSLSSAQLDVVRLHLEAWLTQVFRVFGGYILATGVLTITLAATSFRAHQRGAALGAAISGAASMGLMATVNFIIDSHFKWVLLAIALAWACSLVLFWHETRTQISGHCYNPNQYRECRSRSEGA
jgi:hypothetical protein